MIRSLGITIAASFAGLAGGYVTVHAATQSQSQSTFSQQYQGIQNSNSNAQESASQTSTISTIQSLQLPSQTSSSPVASYQSSQTSADETSTGTDSSSASNIQQTQTIGGSENQNQSTSFGDTSQPVVSGSHNPSTPSTNDFAGYAVFDASGHMLSDTFGSLGNGVQHFDDFQPNIPVVLVVRAVDKLGNPIANPVAARIYLHSNNPDGQVSVVNKHIHSLYMPIGSLCIPFIYTNLGNQAGFDVIDAEVLRSWPTASSICNPRRTGDSSSAWSQTFSWSNGTWTSNHTVASQQTVAGYAVFDLKGNRLSDNFGSASNATAHFDCFQPDQPTILLVCAVNSSGMPIVCPDNCYVNLYSSNPNGIISVAGQATFGVEVPEGSYGVPFVYTNKGASPSYDVIDAKMCSPGVITQSASSTFVPTPGTAVQTTNLTASQEESGTVSTPIAAIQSETTGVGSSQTQSFSGTASDSQTQSSGNITKQTQQISTIGAVSFVQSQSTNTNTLQVQSGTMSSPVAIPGTKTTIAMNQIQAIQPANSLSFTGSSTPNQMTTTDANAAVNAGQSQSASFQVASVTNLYVTQHATASTSGVLLSEGIEVDLSSTGNSSANNGVLNVYINGQFYHTYECDGIVNISEHQSATPMDQNVPLINLADAQSDSASASVDQVQNTQSSGS
ncbi:hypothetical protein SD51_02195, partial [Alicyclobacillus tengchongensis]